MWGDTERLDPGKQGSIEWRGIGHERTSRAWSARPSVRLVSRLCPPASIPAHSYTQAGGEELGKQQDGACQAPLSPKLGGASPALWLDQEQGPGDRGRRGGGGARHVGLPAGKAIDGGWCAWRGEPSLPEPCSQPSRSSHSPR